MPRWVKLGLIVLAGAVVIEAIVGIAVKPQKKDAALAAQSSRNDPVAAARLEQCRATLKKAAAAGILHDLDWKPPQAPYVVVGPTYGDLRSSQKEAFAANVNCFLAAGSDDCIGFALRDQSERPIARYSLCRLQPVN